MEIGGQEWTRRLGGTGLDITAVAVGGGVLGSNPRQFGYTVEAQQAIDMVQAVLASPIRVLDTAAGYADGESERRIGAAIAASGGLPPDYLVITKVDGVQGDFSGARVRASVRESKQRLGLDTLPLVHLHDVELYDEADLMAPGGAVDTLVQLREEGEIGHIGLAGGDLRVVEHYFALGVFEVLLVHNRWTLVDRGAGDIIDRAVSQGLGVFNAAVYGGGILADPHGGHTTYAYTPAAPATLEAVAHMAAACERYGTDLATAALQFSLRDSRVDGTIVGLSRVGRLAPLLESISAELPDELWEELETFVPAPENWLDRD